jgi:hypothetical protein
LPHEYLDPAPAFSPRLERSVQANSGSGDAATIVWTNRGTTSGASNDRFSDVFGANAGAARSVVDAVLADWSRAITSFNRADGTTTLQVSISMSASGTGQGAVAGPASSGVPADGKPRTGSVTIGRGNDTTGDGLGDGGGWYLDPTPTDSAEYLGNSINAFAGYPNPSQSFDLYTVVSLEMTHVLGLISGPAGSPFNSYKLFTSGYLSTLTTPDTAEAGSGNTGSLGYYATFNGPTIDHLMTTNSGGTGGSNWGAPIHTAGGAASVTIGGTTWRGGEDSGNAVYDSARYLPNEVMLRILSDAYGYSIQDPTTLPTLLSVLNTSNGVLTVRGGAASGSSDTISLTQVGTKLRVSVDVGTDTPGSGALAGAGDLPAYVYEYDISSINSVRVYGFDGIDYITVDGVKNTTVYGGAGNDTLRVQRVNSGMSVTLDGEADNDNLYAGYNNNLDFIDGGVLLQGNTGTDTAWFEDQFNTFITPYTLQSASLQRAGMTTVTWAGVDAIQLFTTNAGANVNVWSVTMPTTIQGGSAVDSFYVANTSNVMEEIDGALLLNGGSGSSDSVQFSDTGIANAPVYTISSNTIVRAGMSSVTFNNVESFTLLGGGATDEFRVGSTGNNCVYRIFGGANSDRLYIGDTTSNDRLDPIDGQIIFDGQGGSSDEVNFRDGDESAAGAYVLGQSTVAMGRMATVSFVSTEEVYLDAGSGADTFDVTPSTMIEYFIDGNSGSDAITMRTSGTTSPVNTPNGSTAGVWTFGNRLAVTYTSVETNTVPGQNVPPTISSLSASPSSVVLGTPTTLTANGVADSDGTILAVYFYRESNGVAGFQTDDSYITADSSSPYTTTLQTVGLSVGTYTLYSRVIDNGNALSGVVSTTLSVTAPSNQAPTVASLGASPASVVAGNVFRLTASGVNDPEGALSGVQFYRETNGIAGLQVGGDAAVGSDTTAGDGWYTDVNTAGMSAGTYSYYAIAVDMGGLSSNTVTATNTVTSPTGPVPYYSSVLMHVGPVLVFFMFLQDVGSSLDVSDLTVRNLGTNQTVAVSAVNWDSANKAASFSLATFPPDGNYRATLSGSGVSANGVPMGTNVNVDFSILRGDANGDRRVDFADLLVLAQNYGGTNKSFAQGNFDMDVQGKVDFNDLLLLAQRYGTSLIAAPLVLPSAARSKSRGNLELLE